MVAQYAHQLCSRCANVCVIFHHQDHHERLSQRSSRTIRRKDYAHEPALAAAVWLSGGGGLVAARNAAGEPLRLISIMPAITERKLAEQQLKTERERLELALSAGEMGAYDLNMLVGILWWSPTTYVLFGVTPDSFVPTPEAVAAFIQPGGRDGFHRLRAQGIALREPFSCELRIQRPDGMHVWLGYHGQAE